MRVHYAPATKSMLRVLSVALWLLSLGIAPIRPLQAQKLESVCCVRVEQSVATDGTTAVAGFALGTVGASVQATRHLSARKHILVGALVGAVASVGLNAMFESGQSSLGWIPMVPAFAGAAVLGGLTGWVIYRIRR